MSMDEAIGPDVDSKLGEQQLLLPHTFSGKASRVEVLDGHGHTRHDPATAHEAAGDASWEKFIPDSCFQCWAVQGAQAEATKAAEAMERVNQNG